MGRKKPPNKRTHQVHNLAAGDYRYETFEERPHLVVPVVLMTEGVHSGSNGPIFYPAEELSTLAEAWNGVPVPVFHPQTNDGDPCSCNDPRVIERYNVGRLFNVQFRDNALRGEAYIDIQKAEDVYAGLINMLTSSHINMEVSTGLLSQHEITSGSFNGEDYNAIVRNIRPDHLALLPGSIGACSWQDGCGVRNMDFNQESLKDVEKYVNNILGQREAHAKIYAFVDSMDNDMAIHYLEEVYDDSFIYRKVTRNSQGSASSVEYYKVGYSFDDNEELVIADDVTKVKKQVMYEAVQNNSEGGNKMARKDKKTTNQECPKCAELVDSLIANEHTAWTEDHRSILEEWDEEMLTNAIPVNIPDPVEETDEEEVTTNEEETTTNEPLTREQYIENAPPEIREVLQEGERTLNQKRAELVAQITANDRNQFTEETLKSKPLSELEMIANLATPPDYSGQGGVLHANEDSTEEEPLGLPTLNWKE